MNNLELAAKELNGTVWEKGGKLRVYLKPDFKGRKQSATRVYRIVPYSRPPWHTPRIPAS